MNQSQLLVQVFLLLLCSLSVFTLTDQCLPHEGVDLRPLELALFCEATYNVSVYRLLPLPEGSVSAEKPVSPPSDQQMRTVLSSLRVPTAQYETDFRLVRRIVVQAPNNRGKSESPHDLVCLVFFNAGLNHAVLAFKGIDDRDLTSSVLDHSNVTVAADLHSYPQQDPRKGLENFPFANWPHVKTHRRINAQYSILRDHLHNVLFHGGEHHHFELRSEHTQQREADIEKESLSFPPSKYWKLPSTASISLTGHGIGGLLAQMATLDLGRAVGHLHGKPFVTVFGVPKIGNEGFVQMFQYYCAKSSAYTTVHCPNGGSGDCLRDSVTQLPSEKAFLHASPLNSHEELEVDLHKLQRTADGKPDLNTLHSIGTYVAALTSLLDNEGSDEL